MQSFFSNKLALWYEKNKRDLPWRNIKDPYRIWLSEIILQQTRVVQGLSYYKAFVEAFPDVSALANAPNDVVMKLWQGLGYYSRARNLHATAQYVVNELGGVFPNNYEGLRKLKGVGDYTAAAIASFAYNEPCAVVDGNVYRVLSRVYGIETPIDSTLAKKEFKKLAQELIEQASDAAQHNQAIMELGATQCVQSQPQCSKCPFESMCYAHKNNKIGMLPVKSKQQKVQTMFFTYIVPIYNDNTLIRKRVEKGIWQNLHEFPVIESSQEHKLEELMASAIWSDTLYNICGRLNIDVVVQKVSKTYKHQLTHRTIYARFVKVAVPCMHETVYKQVRWADLDRYAVPRLIDIYINEQNGVDKKGDLAELKLDFGN